MTVVSIILAAIAVLSAVAKLAKNPQVVHSVHEVCGVPMDKLPVLAALEIAGGAGLIVGLWVGWIGVAAAVGLALYFVGAVVAHLRAGDKQGVVAPAVLVVLSVVAAVLLAG
ncbi:MAG: hypothetical protein RI900_206 [Actinomycetota bacterium]